MRLEKRVFSTGTMLVMIVEHEDESKIIDDVLGSTVQDGDGLIADCVGQVRLSDGYAEHYITLKKVPK